MTEPRFVRVALRIATIAVLAFIYLPIVVLAIYAFNASRIQVWPPSDFTAHWFQEAAANPSIVKAFTNSISAGITATILALILGTLAAFAVQRFDFFGRQTVSFLFVLPLALPGVVTGIALRTTYTTFGVDLGLWTIIVGHATFCVVVVFNNVVARLRRVPRTPEEASADLGADSFTTFRRITLPALGTSLVAGALLAFGLSFDEIIVTIFTAGAGTQTVPLWIYSAIQRPNELPVVNVVALVVILLSVIPVYIAQRISGGASETGSLGRT
jgi:putative spermidine/putrescine transport system permease protein